MESIPIDWPACERDPDGDGLLTTIQPDESGLDDSPKYDGVYGWMRHDSPGHAWLIERYRRLGYDARRIAERYEEHVEDVLVNVCYALSLRALARLDSSAGDEYERRAQRTERALLPRCYDERTGLFFDLAGRRERQLKRCWRGPSWMNTTWLLAPPTRELGYHAEARRIIDSLRVAVERHGFREYCNPLTGRGLSARGFGFATLLLDLTIANSGNEAGDPSGVRPMIHP